MEKFIDTHTLKVISGNGAPGASSFRREKCVPFGGPDGGDGGKGSDIVFRTDQRMSSFQHLYSQKEIRAPHGQPGMSQKRCGKNADPTVILVPVGTMIKDENGLLIQDLIEEGQEFVMLKGGKGGQGNCNFATSTNQAPEYFQPGLPGEEAIIQLEMKLIADIGLVGFPNAGKSTFISCVTNAHPKIADYPFTTLSPNLGIWRLDDPYSVVIADIPGIIEGAHNGAGLGLTFLRHIERTRFLFFLIESISPSPYEDFEKLRFELKSYSDSLFEKPFLICITKTDLNQRDFNEIQAEFPKELHSQIYFISAVARQGLENLRKFAHSIPEKSKIESKKW